MAGRGGAILNTMRTDMRPTKDLLEDFYEDELLVVTRFIETYFCEEEEDFASINFFPVGGDTLGVWQISDYFFSINDIVLALEEEIPENVLFAWYDYAIERGMTVSPYLNLDHYWLAEKSKFKTGTSTKPPATSRNTSTTQSISTTLLH
ncbi:hypothetical protein COW46_00730 [Candidatus Gracilibacteria bacterium CG17_big_fil_post_rev_8_21_14_2_50_48_13]|nr:MAG: hypothetical protein COW46_00730 [Candidatus Gracilibacteria bacterium CG17_big_fil_post_rev_8_21_14_2_50_48_13]